MLQVVLLLVGQLLSPGPLSKAHEELEGLGNCTKCHEAGRRLSQRLCLDCHVELKPTVAAGRGFHGLIPEAERDCEKCHLEHQGRGFDQIDWPQGKNKFPHEKTGYPLEGGHKGLACARCHEARLIVDPAVKKLEKKRTETYLGLTAACMPCHFDEHRGQEDKRCELCHSVAKWSPAPRFDHAKTAYPLRGKHQSVECKKCHGTDTDDQTPPSAFPPPRARTFMHMKSIPHARCTDCHEDPHQGRFGKDCASCHTVNGWRILSKRVENINFHEKTHFPLRGAHVGVACAACHGPFPGQPAKFKGLEFARCDACHYDAHVGQIRAKADCATCHEVEDFSPARFEIDDHQKTKYPLEGAHQAVACRSCHPSDPKLQKRIDPKLLRELKQKNRPKLFSFAVFKLRKVERCDTCHADPHGGQFKDLMKKGGCDSCHGIERWKKVSFDHDKTSFPLTGKHRKAECSECHIAEGDEPLPEGDADSRSGEAERKRIVVYKGVEPACKGCHADVHFGQLSGPKGKTGCDGCHETEDFKKTSFDHDDPKFSTYPLEGKHADLACDKCHALVQVSRTEKTVRYKPLPRNCAGCHVDVHEGSMKRFE